MSERLYRLLLLLYPPHFRKRYGQEAMRLFCDRLRDERGVFLRLRLWFDLLADIACSVPGEYRRAPVAFASVQTEPLGGFPSFRGLEIAPVRHNARVLGIVFAIIQLVVIGFVVNHGGNRTTLSGMSWENPLPDARLGTVVDSVTADLGFGSARVSPLQDRRPGRAERQGVIDAVIAQLGKHYDDRDAVHRAEIVIKAHEHNGDYETVNSAASFAGLLTNQLQAVTGNTRLRVVDSANTKTAVTSWRIDDHFSIDIPEARTSRRRLN